MSDLVPVFCPSCGSRFSAAPDVAAAKNVVVLCGMCGVASIGAAFDAVKPLAHADDAAEPVSTLLPRVVIAHEQPGAARTLASVMRSGGYDPLVVGDGAKALAACDRTMVTGVVALIIDVAVPGVLVFEVIAQLRADPATSKLPIILLASVFERTRYKRQPQGLYGADAYLELHHVPDRLVPLVTSLVDATSLEMAHRQSPAERAWAAPFRSNVEVRSADGQRMYARRLISDIALYHADELNRGIRTEAPLQYVQEAIAEARAAFLSVCDAPDAAMVFDAAAQSLRDTLLGRGPGAASG